MAFRSIKLGDEVKVWHYPKGVHYVVSGFNPNTKEVYLLRRNSFNNDGESIHGSVSTHNRTVPYSILNGRNVLPARVRPTGNTLEIEGYASYLASILPSQASVCKDQQFLIPEGDL